MSHLHGALEPTLRVGEVPQESHGIEQVRLPGGVRADEEDRRWSATSTDRKFRQFSSLSRVNLMLHHPPGIHIVRVVVDVGPGGVTVVTAYRTSRIEKYWRSP